MTTLTEFLLARIAEDEAVARAVQEAVQRDYAEDAVGSAMTVYFDVDYLQGGANVSAARVLAECEAKRRIVALHGDDEPNCMGGYVEGLTHRRIIESELSNGVPTGYCDTLRALAAIYAGHPDYRDEWRP